MTQTLLQKSDELQEVADEVVKTTDIVKALESLGEVSFVGSYPLKLLNHTDIDLHVSNENCNLEDAIIKTKELLDTGLYRAVKFIDCFNYPCKQQGKPKGYYWGLDFFVEDVMWKMDIWYSTPEHAFAVKDVEKIKAKLSAQPDARAKILEMKDSSLNKRGKYDDGMSGFKIYEAVLGKFD